MTTAVERFLKYVSYDTQSDEAYDTCPSTKKQLLLANELKTLSWKKWVHPMCG